MSHIVHLPPKNELGECVSPKSLVFGRTLESHVIANVKSRDLALYGVFFLYL